MLLPGRVDTRADSEPAWTQGRGAHGGGAGAVQAAAECELWLYVRALHVCRRVYADIVVVWCECDGWPVVLF